VCSSDLMNAKTISGSPVVLPFLVHKLSKVLHS